MQSEFNGIIFSRTCFTFLYRLASASTDTRLLKPIPYIPVPGISGATQDSDAWISKGRALYKLNKYDEVIKAYDRAIEINPQYSDAWYAKGTDPDKLNKHEEARKSYEKAKEIDSRALDHKGSLSKQIN